MKIFNNQKEIDTESKINSICNELATVLKEIAKTTMKIFNNQKEIDTENKINSICNELATVLKEKNKNYGDSFSKTVDEYGKAVMLIRIQDKLNILKQLIILNNNCDNSEESIEDTFLDIAGYAVLAKIYLQNNKKKYKAE